MTGAAYYGRVPSGQCEAGRAVVEDLFDPRGWRVTGFAIGSAVVVGESILVRILVRMAILTRNHPKAKAETVRIAPMAARARSGFVRSDERIRCVSVMAIQAEKDRLPGRLDMARCAVAAGSNGEVFVVEVDMAGTSLRPFDRSV